ncbi:MAG: OprO/OprP family phosphate-selective porin [Gemmataceae bacterium]|nr:OprO/OprP family phosphate-selective porin [Gemmataceae bacterium]
MMQGRIWTRGAGALAACIAALALVGAPALADEKALLERLDQQAKQIEELRKKLETLGKEPAKNPYISDAAAEKERINKQIDSYLKEKDAKKKADDKLKADAREAEGYEVGKQTSFGGKWLNNQYWFETEDRSFRLHLGGRTQIDQVWVTQNQKITGLRGPGANAASPLSVAGIGRNDDAFAFRRARFAMEGTFWEVFDFNCEYDFFNTQRFDFRQNTGTVADRVQVENVPVPTDLWVTWTKIPLIGNVRVGNQKPWNSFEHLTSSRFLDFLERSSAFDAFVENGNNGFLPGISTFNTYMDDRVFAGIGAYRPNFRNIYGNNVGDGELQVTGRIAATPIYADNGRCMVHAGVSYTHSTADDGVLRYRARSQLRNGSAVLHPTLAIVQLQGNDQNIVVPEFAMNWGPFNMSADYYFATTGQRAGQAFQILGNQTANLPAGGRGTLFYHGGYVTVGYFLTGEHRGYNMKVKSWDRQYVNETAFLVDGPNGVEFGRGAVEVLARFSHLDLSDKGINGGRLNAATFGINWFLNPNAKIQLNYDIGYRDATQLALTGAPGSVAPGGFSSRDGVFQGLGTRLAFDW